MSINFYQAACQEPVITVASFGLCDDQNGTKAYTSITGSEKWIAEVKNDLNRQIVFTAIDKCVIKDGEEAGRGRCDAMLVSDEHLFLVELKDQMKNWITDAIEQLESTIQFLIAHHDTSVFKHKKAFACNKQHKHFQETDNELNLRFFRTYKFRIDVQAEIIIV